MTAVLVTGAMTQRALAITAAQRQPEDLDPFREGDLVIYLAHGIGRIDRIGPEDVAGHSIDIVRITFPEHRMTLRLPLAKARGAGLRRLSSPETIELAMAVTRERPRQGKSIWSKRAQELQDKINSGDLMRLAEVLRDLRRHAGSQEGSFSERRLFEIAIDRFADEVAVCKDGDKAAVLEHLTTALQEAQSRT